MVRKIIVFASVLVLVFGLAMTAQATHTIYNGTMSSTYVNYFRDIVSGIGFNDNYVAFRSGQNEYYMIVGQLEYSNNTFSLKETGTQYRFYTDGSYNSNYMYEVKDISNFSVSVGDDFVYSDLGQFPQLVERGAKYEMLSAVLICIALLGVVVSRFFYHR